MIAGMNSESYLIVFPVVMVIFPSSNNAPLTCVDPNYPGGKKSIALFTERLLAERAREMQPEYGEIVEIGTNTELESYVPLFKSNGFVYFTVDHNAEMGIGVRFPIE